MKTHERSLSSDDIDGAHRLFVELRSGAFKALLPQTHSETDTRVKIIDVILRDVLGWPETLIQREVHIRETGGYVDYVLSTSHPYFVVEAKKAQHQYHLPQQKTRRTYKIGGVIKDDKHVYGDLLQAKNYAINKGVSFCCLTNGTQFLFFRSQNDSGISWDDHIVVLFRNLEEIEKNFALFFHLLSYISVSQGVVHGHLPVTQNYDEALRRFNRLTPAKQVLSRTRERNSLFPALKTVISRVFQDISDESASPEILLNCYVESPRDSSYEKGMGSLLKRRPLDLGYRRKEVVVTKKDAGEFQRAVEFQIKEAGGNPEVLLILGGVGVGKTTFIQRFRKVLARDDIDQGCLWAYVDFNRYSDTGETLLQWFVKQAWESLKADYSSLGIDHYSALKQAYHSEYEQLKRGRLAPLFEQSPQEFELEFAKSLEERELVVDEHFTRMVRVAAKQSHRRPFLVFDNADQFSENTQDEVFRLAQKFAKDIGCASVISLREESYWKNKNHGTLSAFHAISYHVQPPRLNQVISKRFKFAQKLLSEIERDFVDSEENLITKEELAGVLNKISQSVLADDSKYLELLEYLSPFEIRRPLQFLSTFLVSGHTNMDSLLKSYRRGTDIRIGFHEFFTAIALGDREYYSENSSDIVNLFAVDGRSDASNLNRIAIVGRLLKSKYSITPVGEGFVPVSELISDCETFGIFPDTTRSILALLNNKRIAETEAQEKQSLKSATFVRATAAAQYYMEKLIFDFAYLDLVVIDTSIGGEKYYSKIKQLTDELAGLTKNTGEQRLKRIKVRLERAKQLLYYIEDEFSNSTLKRNVEKLDPLVASFFESAQGRVLRQAHAIERDAKKIFG